MFFINGNVKVDNSKVSICCKTGVYENTDICSKCKEHTEVKKESFAFGGFRPNEMVYLDSKQGWSQWL